MSGKSGEKGETKTTIELVFEEYDRAVNESGMFASAHEGYAVLTEEVEGLWEIIKFGQNKNRMREKAVKVAATTIRFIQDICDK